MFQEEFRKRYTTIPLAIYKAVLNHQEGGSLSHQHREFELLAFIEGKAEVFIDLHHYQAEKGDVLIIPPYAIHRIKSNKNFLTSYYCLCFDSTLLCDPALAAALNEEHIHIRQHFSAEDPCSPLLFSYCKNAFLASENAGVGWELESVGNLSLLFANLKKQTNFSEESRTTREKNFAKMVTKYISDNFNSAITSRDAAAALYINHSYFCRIFKKTFGVCFAHYLTSYRLEQAKWTLLNTEDSITDIVYSCGFHDCSYFTKKFKQEYGKTPRAYRKE